MRDGRDAAVFWSTGSGKSLCYQIPPLHAFDVNSGGEAKTGEGDGGAEERGGGGDVAVVISPLISLMQDQVSKLNGAGEEVAVFLGSAQTDPSAEDDALSGRYRLVYATPEKLLAGDFLDRLGHLHRSASGGGEGRICVIAVDESHCVSEWGHDFRPTYRSLGESIRSHPVLTEIPLLALTATAVPRVQRDIIRNLRMRRDVKVVTKSFDRENLIINVYRKPSAGSYRTALEPLVNELISLSRAQASGGAVRGQSTIIYTPTRSLADDIARYLDSRFRTSASAELSPSSSSSPAPLRAEPYHADLSPSSRSDAHSNFLAGTTAVIVATVAFGMGIDKPHVRRVVHWGPPKTVEEYYQQTGRAGRDGRRAEVVMYANSNDFDAYRGDYYLGRLEDEARGAAERSVEALKAYAMDGEGSCRRATLLRFFGEEPKFGERCGTCDACRDRARYGLAGVVRDFAWDGARVVLRAVHDLDGQQGMSVLERALRGGAIEEYRYRRGVNSKRAVEALRSEREDMGRKRPASFLKEMIPSLVSREYLSESIRKMKVPGNAFAVSSLPPDFGIGQSHFFLCCGAFLLLFRIWSLVTENPLRPWEFFSSSVHLGKISLRLLIHLLI